MSETTRREFLRDAALVGGAAVYGGVEMAGGQARKKGAAVSAAPLSAVQPVAVGWLGERAPLVPTGVSWGVPWARGAMARGRDVTVQTGGKAIPTQSWPMAFWPDGSVKWTGIAIAADARLAGPLTVAAATTSAPTSPVNVRETTEAVEITNGPLRCRIGRSGQSLIESMVVDGREVARDGRLIVICEDRSQYETSRTIREDDYTSRIAKVTVEQSGPIRAVVHIEGMHATASIEMGIARQWLPFSVRLYFTAGLSTVRMVHSFVFDGEQATDFIRGLGVAFTVPFREETQNRHVRFATENDGLFSEPVLMSPGYRPSAMQNAAEMQRQQMQGKRIPNLAELPARDQASLKTVAVWDTFKLNQLAPDSFEISKRTNTASSWLHISDGTRARGMVFLGDVSGGLAVGVKSFWQKYPSALEITTLQRRRGR